MYACPSHRALVNYRASRMGVEAAAYKTIKLAVVSDGNRVSSFRLARPSWLGAYGQGTVAVFGLAIPGSRHSRGVAAFARNSSVLGPPLRVVRRGSRTSASCNAAGPAVAPPRPCGTESTWGRNVPAYRVVYSVLALVGTSRVRVICYPIPSFYVCVIYRQ